MLRAGYADVYPALNLSEQTNPTSPPNPLLWLPVRNRNKIAVFRFQSDLITKQNNEDTNKVLLNRSGIGFRVCNELGVFG